MSLRKWEEIQKMLRKEVGNDVCVRAIMKDPLHTELTAYEILGVGREADKAEVEKAFAQALRRHVPPYVAQAARDMLMRKEKRLDRVLCDVTLYDDACLGRLAPNPLEDASVLGSARRLKTAEAWEQQLKRDFPNVGIAHSLGVLWYWWAVYEEQRQDVLVSALPAERLAGKQSKTDLLKAVCTKDGAHGNRGTSNCEHTACAWHEDCCFSAPPLEEMWRRVIAYWSMLWVSPDLWDKWLGLLPAEADKGKKKQGESLRNRLADSAQRYGQRLGGDHPITARYRQLQVALASEAQTAKAMAASGYRTRRGRVGAGVMMLEYLGLLETVRSQVDELVSKDPKNKDMRQLQKVLSPCFPITVLLDNDKPEEALAQIERLSGKVRKSKEADQLRGWAFLLLGRQQRSVRRIEDALTSWGKALESDLTDEMRREVQREVVSTCQSQAAAIQNRDVDQAIDILQKGLALVRDSKLELALADALVTRAIAVFNSGQKELGKASSVASRRRIAQRLLTAKADLEQAAKLGSKDAEKNLKAAESILEAIHDPFMDLPDKVYELIREAQQASGRRDWELAVDKCKAAYRLKKDRRVADALAEALTNRAIASLNKGQEEMKGTPNATARKRIASSFEKAKADLELAAKLGSTRAAENLQAAERLLADLNSGIFEVRELVSAADAAAGREDWDTAVERLREAGRKAGAQTPAFVRKNLAMSLANRAVRNANRAVKMLDDAASAHRDAVETLLGNLRHHYGDNCAMCGTSRYSSYGQSWFTVTLPDGTSAQLCSGCTARLQSLQESAPKPNAEALSLLGSARDDLREAAELDSESEYVRKNLEDVNKLVNEVGGVIPSATPKRARTRARAAGTRSPSPAAGLGERNPPVSHTTTSEWWQSLVGFLAATWWLWLPVLGWLLSRGCR